VQVERAAWESREYDVLARVYMPLQEARRQKRQRCGEGRVVLDLVARGPEDVIDPAPIIERWPFGQLLVAGWGSVAPAVTIRRLAGERSLYLETFLAASYMTSEGLAVAVVGEEAGPLPEPRAWGSLAELATAMPAGTPLLRQSELPKGDRAGNAATYAEVMALWERLHAPLLAEADAQDDLFKRMAGYRRTIAVDSACELAHQKLSDVARHMEQERSRFTVPVSPA
jgi:hypothetical protein